MENCPYCQQAIGLPDWRARKHVRWANQYGRKERVFCNNCGGWFDCEIRGNLLFTYNVVGIHKPDMSKFRVEFPF